jgi:iron complex outermembrane receptor protein
MLKRAFATQGSTIAISAALAAAAIGGAGSAHGQTPAAPETVDQVTPVEAAPPAAPSERIVVTGSLIAGASEDAPLAVDVFSSEELVNQGSPSSTEFVRSLAQSSETAGEIAVDGGPATAGVADINLRGLGSSRTMTLLNGRRTSANTNYIPFSALGRVEVLKEGATVTYGAGAVAGVVNFVTRRDIEGLELSAEKKFYDGSDGEFSIDALWGLQGEASNFLLSVNYAYQDNLPFTAREYGVLPYDVNPVQYTTTGSNPTGYVLGAATINDFNQASCNAIGGYSRQASQCYFAYTPFYDFINEETKIRVYSEYNSDLDENTEFHVEASYAKIDDPSVVAAPTLFPTASHRAVLGYTTQALAANPGRMFALPANTPWAQDFFARAGQAAPATGTLYTGTGWRPFGQGGNPSFGYGGVESTAVSDFFQVSSSLKGEFSRDSMFGFLAGISYDNAVTFSQSVREVQYPDVITANLQNALRGYGGPNCTAVDQTPTNYTSQATYDATVGIQSNTVAPGTGGCEFFNPFISAIPGNPFTGAANPAFNSAWENSKELTDWMQADRGEEYTLTNLTVDMVYSGTVPYFELPGGEIAWAGGAQYRSEEDRTRVTGSDALRRLSRQPCSWADQLPGQSAGGVIVCTADNPGPWFGLGDQIDADTYFDRHVLSLFGELQIPVLPNLNFQLGARREDFGSIKGDVYKVAGKWDILDTLAVRGSYSTNFAAPPSTLRPGVALEAATYVSRFTGTFPTTTQDLSGIAPEEGSNFGAGVIWAPSIGDHDLRFSVDYFDIDVQNQIVTTSITTILNNVAPTGAAAATTPVACSSPFITAGIVTIAGTCVQGTTMASDIANINLFNLNGPGQATSGIDYGFSYRGDVGPGTLSAGLNFSQLLTYEIEGYNVAGIAFESGGDRLGYSNSSRAGDFASELRGNANIGYAFGDHTVRAQVNYIKGVKDEIAEPLAGGADVCPTVAAAPAAGIPATTSCYGIYPEDYADVDLHYRYTPSWISDLELRLSVLNVADVDPPARQARDGYYTRVTSARGRQIEIGVNKKF